jgi:monoamine oxidase
MYDTVEIGAEFVHGENATTWEIIRAEGLTAEPWSFKGMSDYRVYGEDGRIRPDSKEMMAAMYAAEEDLWECEDPAISVNAYVNAQDVPEEIRFYAKRHIGDVEAADTEDLSAAKLAAASRRSTNGEENFRILDGYDRIPEALARGLEVRVGHPVTQVNWKRGSVEVLCANGATFVAPRLVFTVPLGVLKKDLLKFSPALPSSFTGAVSRIGFGDNCKILLWVDSEVPEFRMIDTRGWYGHFWQQKKRNETIITGYCGGSRATKLTNMGEAAAIEVGIEDIASALGEDIRAHVKQARFCSWSDNPYILGSYSYPKLGMGNARTEIQEPVADTLYYCGEASHDKGHASTVHGAIEMGRATAKQILYG